MRVSLLVRQIIQSSARQNSQTNAAVGWHFDRAEFLDLAQSDAISTQRIG
jgi:hypothetical protein